jgi:hypothetical protein
MCGPIIILVWPILALQTLTLKSLVLKMRRKSPPFLSHAAHQADGLRESPTN